jgi:hypothetical protein
MKRRISKFKEFLKINEATEFNLQRFNSDSVGASIHGVDDPSLSTNAFDKHQDGIRQAMSRVGEIMFNLTNTNAFRNLRSKLSLDDQGIQSLKILRITKSNSINYDVYVSFVIDEYEYWGIVKNIMTSPEFKSEVFKDFDLYQSKEWIIKIKGLIVKTIKTWLKPEPGNYKLINDEVICYSTETGRMLRMEKGIEIQLIRSFDNKILVKHESDLYNLVGDNYIYFNWWFEKL